MEILVPVIPGLVAVTSLALSRVNVSPRGGDRTRVYWALLNLGLFVWTFSYFVGLAYAGWTTLPETQPIAKFLFGVGQLGVAMTTTYYFLFSAEVSGIGHLARGGWFFAAHMPAVVLLLSCCVPQLNRLFVTWGSGAAETQFAYGPVGNAVIIALYGLVLTGAMLHMGSVYETRGDESALPHGAFALAGVLPLATNVFWVLRTQLSMDLAFNPTTVAFVIANLAMLGALKSWCTRTSRCGDGFDLMASDPRAEGA